MSRRKETFIPREKGKVKIFTCGPSIYRRPHIGNYRSFMYEDILVRYLRYKGYEVDRVINFTDVEDKTITEAEATNKTVGEVTGEVEEHFFREVDLLKLDIPKTIPRSSTTVPDAAKIIAKLLEDGYAYRYEGDIYFDPLKFDGFGKLFRLDMSRWPKKKIHFKKDTYPGIQWNLGDFILWHGDKGQGQPSWDSEVGPGRPSWNVQDPGMIISHLGEQVDINCGGIDNLWRHHDYNIAIMESYTGKEYANYYLHGEHLIVDGKTMSKSKGNILYPDEVTDKYKDGIHLRFFLFSEYYKKKLNFTEKRYHAESERLDSIRALVSALIQGDGSGTYDHRLKTIIGTVPTVFESYLDDDLRIGDACKALHETLQDIEKTAGGRALPSAAAKDLRTHLEKIDTVTQVLL